MELLVGVHEPKNQVGVGSWRCRFDAEFISGPDRAQARANLSLCKWVSTGCCLRKGFRKCRFRGIFMITRNRRIGSIHSVLSTTLPSTAKVERTLQLPIDYYQVLGADTHNLADAIVRAYEARVSNPPTEGYSKETLRARQEILWAARNTLADPELRGEYNNNLLEDEAGTLVVEVPWSKVPGALCLLQEVGEVEVVLQVGQALLEERLSAAFKQDVILAMALAYVELSREAMAQTPPAIVKSCDLLNTAMRLLQEEGGDNLAPGLQKQIDETLEEITPRCILEILALPLDGEHKSQREVGLQELRHLLWDGGDVTFMVLGGAFTREQFMKEAFSRMAAPEQVALFIETPSSIPAERSEVYSVALAHVAEGFNAKKPQLIQEAGALFLQLQDAFASANDQNTIPTLEEQRDVALGRAMCALLLGEVDNCKVLLGLDDENSPLRYPDVVEFVIAKSEGSEDGDLLPGLCKLLEGWLSEEVYASFRDTEGLEVRLGSYFDDPDVLNYLEKSEKGRGSPLEAAAAIGRIGEAFNSVKATLRRAFPIGKLKESSQDHKDLRFKGSSSVTQLQDKHDEGHTSIGLDRGLQEEGIIKWTDTESDSDLPNLDQSLVNNEASWGLTATQIACSGAVFGLLVMAGMRFLPVQSTLAKLSRSLVGASGPPSGMLEKYVSTEEPRMDAHLAEQLVRKWQIAKAQALGPMHSIFQLSEILDGQMLKSWSERAADVSKRGWYWDYKLLGLSIESVTISEDGKRTTVEATLQEAARRFDSTNPDHDDSYRSTYTTRYELVYGEHGWRIVGGAVLRS